MNCVATARPSAPNAWLTCDTGRAERLLLSATLTIPSENTNRTLCISLSRVRNIKSLCTWDSLVALLFSSWVYVGHDALKRHSTPYSSFLLALPSSGSTQTRLGVFLRNQATVERFPDSARTDDYLVQPKAFATNTLFGHDDDSW